MAINGARKVVLLETVSVVTVSVHRVHPFQSSTGLMGYRIVNLTETEYALAMSMFPSMAIPFIS
jgi:hypothetical protein